MSKEGVVKVVEDLGVFPFEQDWDDDELPPSPTFTPKSKQMNRTSAVHQNLCDLGKEENSTQFKLSV